MINDVIEDTIKTEISHCRSLKQYLAFKSELITEVIAEMGYYAVALMAR